MSKLLESAEAPAGVRSITASYEKRRPPIANCNA